MKRDLNFASFDSSLDEADYVLVGAPYDKTSSFRTGSKHAPSKIRESSYCFEPYIEEHSVSLDRLELHDAGDIENTGDFESLKKELIQFISSRVEKKKFPIILGGEHSISPIAVEALKDQFYDLNVLTLDAHLDFRDRYEGLEHSHATVNRRISELVGTSNLAVLGVRSISSQSFDVEMPLYVNSRDIESVNQTLDKITDSLSSPIYLSIDMDVLDPSYAPGVGNPEPFGLSSLDVKEIIKNLSGDLVGMDVVEVSPKYDESDITSNLAARFIYELIGAREKINKKY